MEAPPNKPTPLGRLDKVNPLLSFAMINSTPSVGRMEWKFPGGFTVKEEAVVSLRATLHSMLNSSRFGLLWGLDYFVYLV